MEYFFPLILKKFNSNTISALRNSNTINFKRQFRTIFIMTFTIIIRNMHIIYNFMSAGRIALPVRILLVLDIDQSHVLAQVPYCRKKIMQDYGLTYICTVNMQVNILPDLFSFYCSCYHSKFNIKFSLRNRLH